MLDDEDDRTNTYIWLKHEDDGEMEMIAERSYFGEPRKQKNGRKTNYKTDKNVNNG